MRIAGASEREPEAALLAAIAVARTTCELLLWRAVEAQHITSTMLLVDTLVEQTELERIIEESKPPAPPRPHALHWLLYTPFRYPPLPAGSRFRGPADPGVWYGAEEPRTACAEVGYWRWRFLMASPALQRMPDKAQTVFQAAVEGTGIDLRSAPFASRQREWEHADDYTACQQLARAARSAGVALVRYASVRDPQHGGCGALLRSEAFAMQQPLVLETWLLSIDRRRVVWASTSSLVTRSFEFDAAGWNAGRAGTSG